MYCVGIDDSQRSLGVCILAEGSKGSRKTKTLSNGQDSAQILAKWLILQKCELSQTHVIVEATGIYHEYLACGHLLGGIGVQRRNGSMKRRGHAVLADKAYSEHSLRNELKRKGIKTVNLRKTNEKMAADGRSQLDRDAYHNRNVVERCFGRLKEYRRIATCYDKTARNYLTMVKL